MPVYALGEKRPQLPGSDAHWIAPGAQVIGDVLVGENVGIWFNAVLRGDNDPITIGKGTNIQDGVMVHTDLGFPTAIGDGCTIGHHAIIHGCTIGDNSLIGMGATVLNGAVIGNNCLVGANALVSEGKIFPDNSLIVGAPARVVRTLDDSAVARLRLSAQNYVLNWQRFQSDLELI
ncbi:acetyltransferase [Rhizobium sp. Root274]|uniref:gamma carbonic anhydrase family protein n=1 Tax=unclassified Rhizobium TaxID=2613769 RepID=UPI00071312CF|nr:MULTISPECIES: gamma carbonic anhydrase family protein [unclassified Rhizobium]KQW27582.1 acetyltransferase [Rhizobium sp. Root1240]KRD27820.1 acetyltransferase [Rhizobium sp. Root274]